MTLKTTIAGVILVTLPLTAGAGELSGAATLASEYIYRGQAVSNHEPAVSFGVDYAHDSGFFGGVWASTIELDSPFGSRDTELDYYVGYLFEPAGPLTLSLSVMRYTYPGHEGVLDYEYTEGALAATLFERYSLEFAYTDDIYGLGKPARHWALRGEWPAGSYWVASAGIGLADLSAINTDRYAYWDIGLSTRWRRVTADLRWHDNEDIEGIFSIWSAGSRLVASLSYGF